MPVYLHHRYEPHECRAVLAAFTGRESLLRERVTVALCGSGDHEIWWTVEARTEAGALRLLPAYVAEHTTSACVSEVEIP